MEQKAPRPILFKRGRPLQPPRLQLHRERIAPGRASRPRLRRAAVVSLILHATALALTLIVIRSSPRPEEPVPPAEVAMVFDSGAKQAPSQPEPAVKEGSGLPKASPVPPQAQPPLPLPPEPAPAPPAPEAAPPPPPPPLVQAPPSPATPAPPQAEVRPQAPAPLPSPARPAPAPPQVPPPAVPAPAPPPPPLALAKPAPPAVHLDMPPLLAPLPVPEFAPSPPPPARPAPPNRPPARAQTAFPAPTMGRWSLGSPREGPRSASLSARTDSAELGADWINALSDWIERHKYYPEQAARNGEEGDVTIAVVVAADGRVLSVDLTQRSGSTWLDLAFQSMFRNARVPPFPPGTSDQQTTVHLTMHYLLIR